MTITQGNNTPEPLVKPSAIDKPGRHVLSRPEIASRFRRPQRASHGSPRPDDGIAQASHTHIRDRINDHEDSRRQMAMALGFLTEQQVADLAIIKLSTLGEWRKRGEGPRYSRFGNAFLYHSQSVQEFLIAKQHEPSRSWVNV